MLKAVFDEECGFDDYYIVQKDVEMELSSAIFGYINMIKEEKGEEPLQELTPEIEAEWFDKYRGHPRKLINSVLGLGDCISDMSREAYSHGIFNDICFNSGEPSMCEYYKMRNIRLKLDDSPSTDDVFVFAQREIEKA